MESKLPQLDVLLESYGGHPVAGYRIAQLIRDLACSVSFLVPNRAYSAATLLCLSGDDVRFGHHAGLSPIDISLVSEEDGGRREVELANLDGFLEFTKRARTEIERDLARGACKGRTCVDSDLLVAMVKEVGALQVGKYFRERTLTGHYAQELLDTYMFSRLPDGVERRNDLIRNLLFNAPAHLFHLDYHLCLKWKMIVQEMGTDESDRSKKIIQKLETLMEEGVICFTISRRSRFAFFGFYPCPPQALAVGAAS
jgi:hypothetical protein